MFGRMIGVDAAGVADLRRDVRDVRGRRSRSRARPSSTARRCCATPASTSRRGTARAAGTWRTRRSASASPTPSSWRRRPPNASNGSVNGGHDALTALGGAVPIVNMFTGEVIFGGVGSGLYGMFFYVLHRRLHRRPDGRADARIPRQEDRGARDQARRGRRALRADAGARPDRDRRSSPTTGSRRSSTPARTASREALYAYTSQANNNGSAFAGYGATEFSALVGAIALWLGRFVPLIAALALGGSLAGEEDRPRPRQERSAPTAPTFVVLLVGVIVL